MPKEFYETLDPRWENNTSEPRKSAWAAYLKAHDTALEGYDAEREKARSDYIKHRTGYLRGSILQPTLGQVFFTGWPTDAQIAEFNQRMMSALEEFEKILFNAARQFERKEREARSAYWKAVESGGTMD